MAVALEMQGKMDLATLITSERQEEEAAGEQMVVMAIALLLGQAAQIKGQEVRLLRIAETHTL
jgi:hypothetical protein